MVLSSNFQPYDKMVETSENTWDSINVDGCETVYYYGHPLKEYTENKIYLDIQETYNNLGYKTLMAFDWALQNKEFDYIARVNASTYVEKKELLNYVKDLKNENIFSGLEVAKSLESDHWIWGPAFIISKDVAQKLVDAKAYLDTNLMEDKGISFLANKLNIPYTQGRMCSIDKMENSWRCLCYGTESIEFTQFSELHKIKDQFFFRCKQDYDRNVDAFVMESLFNVLK